MKHSALLAALIAALSLAACGKTEAPAEAPKAEAVAPAAPAPAAPAEAVAPAAPAADAAVPAAADAAAPAAPADGKCGAKK